MKDRATQLMRYSKKDLAEKCAVLEKNVKVMKERFEIQYLNCIKMVDTMKILNKTFKESIKGA